jgi:hypothetical protein
MYIQGKKNLPNMDVDCDGATAFAGGKCGDDLTGQGTSRSLSLHSIAGN